MERGQHKNHQLAWQLLHGAAGASFLWMRHAQCIKSSLCHCYVLCYFFFFTIVAKLSVLYLIQYGPANGNSEGHNVGLVSLPSVWSLNLQSIFFSTWWVREYLVVLSHRMLPRRESRYIFERMYEIDLVNIYVKYYSLIISFFEA